MSRTPEELIVLADQYENICISAELIGSADELLNKTAKDKKKLDPKAKVRSRGTAVFPAESSNVKDHKDHFPINDAAQARNALARCMRYDAVPPWYKGSLKSLQEAVRRKVHSKYPAIGKDKKKSSAIDISPNLLSKYGH